jgi:hypothetical protein
MADPQTAVRSAYARLAALADHLPRLVWEEDVARYHAIVDDLERAGHDLGAFRIDPERDMFRRALTVDGHGRKTYSPDRQVRADVFASRVTALLSFFRLETARTPIGFDAPLRASSQSPRH